MQDGSAIPAGEAGQWLRDHFKDGPEPHVSITWEITEPNDAVFHEVLDILFTPESGERAA